MTEKQSPMAALLDLVSSEASGEFVAVSATCELHVYLQSGRIAWATDSTRPFAFSRHLLNHTSLTTEVFQEVLEACRRDRLPLGETLLARKVATLDQIRAALTHQISEALRSLRKVAIERTIFLERRRQFASYDTRLTFDVQAIMPPVSNPRIAIPVFRDGPESREQLLDRVRPLIPDAAWLEVLDGERTVERDPDHADSFVPRDILKQTLLDGTDVATIRTGRDTLLGVTLPSSSAQKTLWCRLDVESAFGFTLTALCRFAGIGVGTTTRTSTPEDRMRTSRLLGKNQASEEAAVIRTLMDRAPEIEAIVFCEGDSLVSAAVRTDVDADRVRAVIRKRATVLSQLATASPDDAHDIEELGYQLRSLSTAEDRFWSFGTEIPALKGRTLWVFTGRSSPPGLGWAYLTSLARQLAGVDASNLAATG